MADLPVVVTEAGAQPTSPKKLLTELINKVSAIVPGYTANLPAALITDLASTATGAVALIDSAMVDTINSVTPYGANVPMLMQLGNIYGVPQGVGYNTSVYTVFMGPAGFVIPKGFIVSDGNHQYAVQNNGVIPTNGQSEPIYCLATTSGTWAVPSGSVNMIVTSIPQDFAVTCTNLNPGLPGAGAQPEWSYRAQVMQAGMMAVQGTPDCLESELMKVSGVKRNLIGFRQVALGQWVVIAGGGDPYQVGLAIYQAIPDISMLTTEVTDSNSGSPAPTSVTVTINNYPDSYDIPFITPTSQAVKAIITWNSTSENFIDPASISAAVVPRVVQYINAIPVGQPVNIYQIQTIFQLAVTTLVNPALISLIDVAIAIDGVIVPPDSNTDLVSGDAYSFFTTDSASVTVQQYASAS